MTMHIDYAPVKNCKHPEKTYGIICVQCNECGRFDYRGESNPVQSEIQLITQRHMGVPPLWEYPEREGGYYKGGKCWYLMKEKIKAGTTLKDIISEWWYPDRLPYLRWWLEGRNY